MLKILLGLKYLGLIGLLLGMSCSYTPLVQGSPGCQKTSGSKGDEPFALFFDETYQQSPKSISNPSTSWERRLFEKAYSYFKQGDFPMARVRFLELVDHYPELADYVQHYLAQTEAALGRYVAAIDYWQELISRFPHSRLIPEAKLGMADTYFMQGEFKEAGYLYQQLLNERWEDKQLRPTTYQMLARCYEQLEDFSPAMATYHQLWLRYPAASQAETAGKRIAHLSQTYSLSYLAPTEQEYLKRIGRLIREAEFATAYDELEQFRKRFPGSPLIPKTYLKQAQCYLGQQKSTKAIKSFKQLIKRFPKNRLAAEARYKLARLYWNQGQDRLAKSYLHKIIADQKARHWQDNAFYILARIYEENQKYAKAIETYQQLITKFPFSPSSHTARWRQGWIHYYYLGDYAKAAACFAEVTNNNNGLYRSSLYWQGRCAEELNDWQQALTLYIRLMEETGNTYYAQLADHRLTDLMATKTVTQVNYPVSPKRDELSLLADPFLISRLLTDANKFHLVRVREFAALFMFEASTRELNEVTYPHNPAPEFWYQLSQIYHLLGNHTKPINLIQRIVNYARKNRLELPPAVWKICYPLNYWSLIQKQAEARDIDPYLVAAVIKQESVFDPKALSTAGARGLMQVIPATGQELARELKLTGFSPNMLYKPETNLALGSYYLTRLLKKFDGNLVLALAAYNAGEKAAKKWWEKYESDDLAQFIENIPYPETRNYVKQVWNNYNNYHRIYPVEQ